MKAIRLSVCGNCELYSRLGRSIPDENIIFHYIKRNAGDTDEITYIVKELLLDSQLLSDITYYGGTLDVVDT